MSALMPQGNIHVKHQYSHGPVSVRAVAAHIGDVKRLRRIRESRKLSQARLAELAGVSQPTVSKLENGDMNATLDKIVAIAGALGVEPQELFELPDLHARALEAIGRISPEQRPSR